MSFLPNDQVWVENLGDVPFELGWNSKYTTVEPGKKELVVVEAAINKFGDPRSGPTGTKFKIGEEVYVIPSRQEEITRLQTNAGFNSGRIDELPSDRPKAKVTTIHGEELVMVADDPKGTKSAPAVSPQDAGDQIAQLKTQIQALEEMMAQTQRASSEDDLPADEPETVTPTPPGQAGAIGGPPITPEEIPEMPQPAFTNAFADLPSDEPGA